MKYTYYIRSLIHNSISTRVAFNSIEMAILRKKNFKQKAIKSLSIAPMKTATQSE